MRAIISFLLFDEACAPSSAVPAPPDLDIPGVDAVEGAISPRPRTWVPYIFSYSWLCRLKGDSFGLLEYIGRHLLLS